MSEETPMLTQRQLEFLKEQDYYLQIEKTYVKDEYYKAGTSDRLELGYSPNELKLNYQNSDPYTEINDTYKYAICKYNDNYNSFEYVVSFNDFNGLEEWVNDQIGKNLKS